ncbi:hypothetical protein [Paenibacillus sp. NAIST15-1]|uniref:hypothetical protein n=1 Tax=Paenibacillus sp. NAIST15-1 TaxID=1605994 RepID=UPI00086DC716|nr:hypothetical protein [Paenibacillus sp. NAIST15-1]GAV11328.1 hypothetical protein PBN151_1255 [Paenibacillus sp. NAIST15-1]
MSNQLKDFYETNAFECPTTKALIKGVYFPSLNELKFRVNEKTEETDWETLKWRLKAEIRILGGLKAANDHLEKLGLNVAEINFN